MYTLHAITVGLSNDNNNFMMIDLHDATWYYEFDDTSTEMTESICNGESGYNCSIGNGVLLHFENGLSYDYTLTVTWNGEAITSGVLSQSNNNGDHVYRFYLHVGDIGDVVQRNKYHTISGKFSDL